MGREGRNNGQGVCRSAKDMQGGINALMDGEARGDGCMTGRAVKQGESLMGWTGGRTQLSKVLKAEFHK